MKVVLVAIAVAGLVACNSSSSSTRPPLPSASSTATIDRPAPASPSQAPKQAYAGPPGSLLTRAHGTGVTVVKVLRLTGSRLTVRFTCVGTGTVTITDATGGLILGIGGCQRGVIYSSAWSRTRHDGHTIKITVDPTTIWALDLWNGNPVVTLTGPVTA